MDALPAPVAALVARLAAAPGVVAVTLGGSRAAGTADAGSDWDLGLYYRGPLEVAEAAHARLCERRAWHLNEKRILEAAGLGMVQPLFTRGPGPAGLTAWVAEVEAALAPGPG